MDTVQLSGLLGFPEVDYVSRFFDGVDDAVAVHLKADRPPSEENLTFLLGQYLDQGSPLQRMLVYSLDALNADLSACGTGSQVDLEFATNEHSKRFEGCVSYADLGIVVQWDRSVFGPSRRKALLLQAKRLYPRDGAYSLWSRYEEFKRQQFLKLKAINSKYSGHGAAYLLYNPQLSGFGPDDADAVRAIEAAGASGWGVGDPRHRRFLMEEFGLPGWPRWGATSLPTDATSTDLSREARAAWVERRPGLRVVPVHHLDSCVKQNDDRDTTFSLSDCYKQLYGRGSLSFAPLAAAVVEGLLACQLGSEDPAVVRIAEGQPPLPEDPENPASGIGAQHTLKITVRSTLHQSDFTLNSQ